jgi:polysaccharide pyruvyl transferase WcaK-like protein
MKNNHPVITLLGNNSGRNLGDAAILSSILDNLSAELPDAEFLVPSIAPKFIDDNYRKNGEPSKGSESQGRYNVKGINVLPQTGSIRLLGIPTLRAMAKSDVALICDGIIFGHKLFSFHNFLITLIFLVPWSWITKCRLVAFCCGIGPFPSRLSERMAKFLLNNCDLITMRELESKAVAERIGVTRPIQVSGDIAFINPVNSLKRGAEVLVEAGINPELPILGINVTPYIDDWLSADRKLADRSKFLSTVAEGVQQFKASLNKAQGNDTTQIVLFSCSPMDEEYSRSLASMINGVVIDNSTYLSHDIQAAMKHCRILVGMRFHSLVLASSVEVPIVGLIYAPKVRDYFAYLESKDFSLELNELTPDSLAETIERAWKGAEELQAKQQNLVRILRQRARESVTQLVARYFSDASKEKSADSQAA